MEANFIDSESDSTAFVGMFALAQRARVSLYRETCVSYQDNLQSRKTGFISKAVTVSRAELPLQAQLGKVWWEVQRHRQKVSHGHRQLWIRHRVQQSFPSTTLCTLAAARQRSWAPREEEEVGCEGSAGLPSMAGPFEGSAHASGLRQGGTFWPMPLQTGPGRRGDH